MYLLIGGVLVAKSQENWSKPVEAASYWAIQKWIKRFEFLVVRYIWSSCVKLLKYMVFPKNLTNVFFIKLIISVTTALSSGFLWKKLWSACSKFSEMFVSTTVSTKSIRMDSDNPNCRLIFGLSAWYKLDSSMMTSSSCSEISPNFLFLNP